MRIFQSLVVASLSLGLTGASPAWACEEDEGEWEEAWVEEAEEAMRQAMDEQRRAMEEQRQAMEEQRQAMEEARQAMEEAMEAEREALEAEREAEADRFDGFGRGIEAMVEAIIARELAEIEAEVSRYGIDLDLDLDIDIDVE